MRSIVLLSVQNIRVISAAWTARAVSDLSRQQRRRGRCPEGIAQESNYVANYLGIFVGFGNATRLCTPCPDFLGLLDPNP
jgi:hypothetical protein